MNLALNKHIRAMTHQEFFTRFQTEKDCRFHFKSVREKQGINCKSCGEKSHYWLNGRWMWQCKSCGFITTLRSGTIMQNSKLPLRDWYFSMHLMTSGKKSISGCELQRQLSRKRYEPVWYMMQKIRAAMSTANTELQLTGDIELDDAFVTAFEEDKTPEEKNKRGRGSKSKTKVFVAIEADKSVTRRGKVGKLMMLATDKVDGKSVEELNEILSKAEHIHTDGYSSYSKLNRAKHRPLVVPSKEAHHILLCVHTAIGNLKRVLTGIFHRINKVYLQLYLDEFCYKFNFRHHKNAIFSLITTAAVTEL